MPSERQKRLSYANLVMACVRVAVANGIDQLPFQDPFPVRNLQSLDSYPEGDNPGSIHLTKRLGTRIDVFLYVFLSLDEEVI